MPKYNDFDLDLQKDNPGKEVQFVNYTHMGSKCVIRTADDPESCLPNCYETNY